MGVIRLDKWTLPAGQVLRRVLRDNPSQEYFVYVPRSATSDPPLLVVVHGRSRNAREQADRFAEVCEAAGVVLIAPHFSSDAFPDYQRLGRPGRRADLVLHSIVQEGASLTGAAVDKVYLFGFSGGAQFAHRYSMVHPEQVAGVVLAAAGWYTFPDTRRRFPYGIRPHRHLANVVLDPEEFLRVPMAVVIGEEDKARDKSFRTTERLDAQQGSTRVERAHNWVAAMRAAARAYGREPQVSLVPVAGVAHSFRRFMRDGRLAELVINLLFSGKRMYPHNQPVNLQMEKSWEESERLAGWEQRDEAAQ